MDRRELFSRKEVFSLRVRCRFPQEELGSVKRSSRTGVPAPRSHGRGKLQAALDELRCWRPGNWFGNGSDLCKLQIGRIERKILAAEPLGSKVR
jgi:hypothetical protein